MNPIRRILVFLHLAKQPETPATVPTGSYPYPIYVLDKISTPDWPGPYYFRKKRWQGDLLMVLDQLRLCVRANAPMGPALGMAAQDLLEADHVWSSYRVGRLLKVLGIAAIGAIALLSSLSAILEEGGNGIPRLIKPILLCVWLVFALRKELHKPAAIFAVLHNQLSAGRTLSEAMARMPRFFPKDLVALIAVGEETGKLGEVLDSFSQKSIVLWTGERELNNGMRYVTMLLAMLSGIVAFMMTKVLPVFEEIQMDQGVVTDTARWIPGTYIPLPSILDLFAIGDFLTAHLTSIIGAAWLIALWIYIRPMRKRRNWASRVESTLLFSIPGLRGLVARQNLGMMAYMLRALLAAGASMEHALNTLIAGDFHPLYISWLRKVRASVMNGNTLRDACGGIRMVPVPHSFLALIAMGESHGRLDQSLAYIAEQYETQVERRRKFLMAMVFPLGIFFAGYGVLSIEMASFQAFIAMSDSLMP